MKPVKAGGGKRLWFRDATEAEKGQETGVSLTAPEKIRDLQRKLYVKAKEEPTYRFYSLYDKIWRPDILRHAWEVSKANKGKPGVDKVTFEQVEAGGLDDWLGRLGEDLRLERYQPDAVRRVYIPKPGGGERPLGIPTVRDRVAQTAAKLVLEPIFEADFGGEMYGYRPKRSAQGAVEEVHKALKSGYTDVVDADLSKYFDTIPHADLMKALARRICDGKVLHLVKMWLKTPVHERDESGHTKISGGRESTMGTPQGGVISPLLANIYMNRFLRAWRERDMNRRLKAKIVNYADDFVILSHGMAEEALDVTRKWMTNIKLTLNETKTRLRDAKSETFDFLGYTFGPTVHRPTGRMYMGASPSKKAIARLRDHVREILVPKNNSPWKVVAKRVNQTVQGWRNYFRYGNTTRAYWIVDGFLLRRVQGFLTRRHKVPGRGTRRFPAEWVFGEGGIRMVKAPVRAAHSNA